MISRFLTLNILVYFLFSTCLVTSQNIPETLPKNYIAYHTNEKIIMDGKGDESSWGKAIWTDDFIDIEGLKIPKYRTHIKMLWSDSYIYFYVELEEPHVWADIKKRDAIVFYNNDFEIFIDPDGDSHNYYELEMNALNTIWDLFITKPYREHGLVLNNWDYKNIKTAVHIDGTLNDPKDLDKKWSIEIAIPWKDINETYTDEIISAKGKTWRINFSRVNWNFDIVDGKYHRKKDDKTNAYLPEYNWVWSPQGVINMHEPEKWGYVYFSEKNIGQKDVFVYGKDESIKLELYKIHRKLRSYYSKHAIWNNSLIPKSIMVNNKKINLKTTINSVAYTIALKSPFTGKILYIDQNGKIINQKTK